MENQDVKRSSFNGHDTGQPESPKSRAVPATLLPAVLSHIGLVEGPMTLGDLAGAALRDASVPVRAVAVRRLGEGRMASSLPFLVSALHDPAWEVRAAAVWALAAFGEYAPVDALREALSDEDGSVRAAALRVLSSVRGLIPLVSLTDMLQDADWLVREAAALTVEERGKHVPAGPPSARSRDDREGYDEVAQALPQPSSPETLPLTFPTLAPAVQRAAQVEVLGGHYELHGSFARGGMATIYRGWDRQADRVVAIKVLQELYTTEPKFVQRFEREAKSASSLHHPNIVQVFDYGQADDSYYIVMELVEGTNLRRYLRSRGVLDSKRAIIIAHDIALGLGAAHRRMIVHRDVKPQNILVSRDGSIKLTDFGIASVYQDQDAFRLTTTGMTLGTVQYMPPEQAQGEVVSPAADVYALGVVMYEMLTGRTPFDGETSVAVALQHIQDEPRPPSQLNPAIPPALEEIVLRCLEKVPEMRYRDGSQLARALESLSEAAFAGALPSTVGSQQAPSHQIPARPVKSRSATEQDEQPAMLLPNPLPPVSTPTESNEGSLAPAPVAASQLPFSMPPGAPSGSGPVHLHAHGSPPSRNNRRARSPIIATALILLAASFLLCFSILLDARLGFIHLPFPANGGPSPAPTVASATVPDLRGKDFVTAQSVALSAGFQLRVDGYTSPATPPASYVVTKQSPQAGSIAPRGSIIEVTMHAKMIPAGTPTPGPSPTSK